MKNALIAEQDIRSQMYLKIAIIVGCASAVGNIFFNVKEVRQFLMLNGYVFTLRKPRNVGEAIAVVGNYYKYEPIGKVFVQLIKEDIKHPHELSPYVNGSGIEAPLTLNDMCYDDDAHHWFALANKMSGQKLNLYLVTMDMTNWYKIK
jgi:hypothetical protein